MILVFLTTLFLLAILPLKISGQKNTERKITATTEYYATSQFIYAKFFQTGYDPFKNLPNTPVYTCRVSAVALDFPVEAVKIEKKEITDGEILDEINKYDWNFKQVIAIAKCESNFDTDVISKTGDVGFLQINLAAHWDKIPGETMDDKVLWLQDFKNNVKIAYDIYHEAGDKFNPWVCFTKGIYK